MPRQKKYAKMTISGAVICYAYTRKEAAKKLDCKLKDVYLYHFQYRGHNELPRYA